MGNIPIFMRDDEVKEFVEQWGPLKAFNLVKDLTKPGQSKGYCFFEFATDDDRQIDELVDILTKQELLGRRLKVQRASIGKRPLEYN
mmetsp:Transcript_115669/g.248529  ORF Transcript_115669/g.248529 Transcript_115669/m.248529 type:complete len:87 (+) Transcript_115669:514-774(+)|eukprot:CAMPEP_0116921926 /NCGR_PEP_ID=MMETSP0467-20121206/21940_1 /TAXON_ID=283647 /ORGANISM="Mesodinium pulex, Strain SPMC105" /LENGTH=86 /DNA_ID=CAMNT_0004600125 /DNA_START=446 /DNA_END=706 /DNA_ORIENTATION=+